jgi:hypothetical protein
MSKVVSLEQYVDRKISDAIAGFNEILADAHLKLTPAEFNEFAEDFLKEIDRLKKLVREKNNE